MVQAGSSCIAIQAINIAISFCTYQSHNQSQTLAFILSASRRHPSTPLHHHRLPTLDAGIMADEGTLLPTSLLESVVASVTSSALEAIATAIESPPASSSTSSDDDVPEGNYVIVRLLSPLLS